MQDRRKGRARIDRASGGLTVAKAIVGIPRSLPFCRSRSFAPRSCCDRQSPMSLCGFRQAADEQHIRPRQVESVAALIETGLLFVLSPIVIGGAKRLLWERPPSRHRPPPSW